MPLLWGWSRGCEGSFKLQQDLEERAGGLPHSVFVSL